VDALSLGALSASALTEGIKFLYSQAGEVLRRRRERSDTGDQDTAVTVVPEAQAALEQPMLPARIDDAALAGLESEIRVLRSALADYAQEIDVVDPSDSELLETVHALRRALEGVLRQSLTLRGEQRPAGPDIDVALRVGEVEGEVRGVVARLVEGGRINATLHIDRVGGQGRVTGFQSDEIGR
jgi:hypothetical protein